MSEIKLTCLLVDDEPLALKLIEGYAKKVPFLDVKGSCHSALEAMEWYNREPVDLLFLDIQMPELSGLELSKILPKTTRVIFTTAFDKYAIDGYKVEAIDYLLKPFDFNEFLLAATKAREWFALTRGVKSETKETASGYIFVNSEYKQLKINLHEILYIEGMKDYVKIWITSRPKPILTLMSLKTFEAELPKNQFMRIHRSFIISLQHIEYVERNQVIINKQRINIADQYRESFIDFMAQNSMK